MSLTHLGAPGGLWSQTEAISRADFFPSLTPLANPENNVVIKIDFGPGDKISGQSDHFKIYFWLSFLRREKKGFYSKRGRQRILFFSLSGLFLCVLRIPEEKLAVHNFWGWVLSGGAAASWLIHDSFMRIRKHLPRYILLSPNLINELLKLVVLVLNLSKKKSSGTL